MTVLLIDDEEHVLRAFTRLFRRHPHVRLVPAQSVTEALELLEAQSFDAALVDRNMPGSVTGPQFLRVLADRWPHMHRVLCSGDVLRGPDTRLAHAVVMKPASLEELEQALDPAQPLAAVG